MQLPGELFQEAVSVEYILQQPNRAPPAFVLVLDLSQSLEALSVSLICIKSHYPVVAGEKQPITCAWHAGHEAECEADAADTAGVLSCWTHHLWRNGDRWSNRQQLLHATMSFK